MYAVYTHIYIQTHAHTHAHTMTDIYIVYFCTPPLPSTRQNTQILSIYRTHMRSHVIANAYAIPRDLLCMHNMSHTHTHTHTRTRTCT